MNGNANGTFSGQNYECDEIGKTVFVTGDMPPRNKVEDVSAEKKNSNDGLQRSSYGLDRTPMIDQNAIKAGAYTDSLDVKPNNSTERANDFEIDIEVTDVADWPDTSPENGNMSYVSGTTGDAKEVYRGPMQYSGPPVQNGMREPLPEYRPMMNGPVKPPVPPKPPKPPKSSKRKADGEKRKVWPRVLFAICLAIIFGVATGITILGVAHHYGDKLPMFGYGRESKIEDKDKKKDKAKIEDWETPDDEDVYEEFSEEDPEDIYDEIQDDSRDNPDDNTDGGSIKKVDIDSEESSESAAVTAMDVSQVVEEVMPSVVSITGNYIITSEYWGYYYEQESSGSGSGIIIGCEDDALLIATNNHVVEDANELSVQFIDGTTAEATIKGTDSKIDLAVIIVKLSELSNSTKDSIRVAVLGDSDSIKVGEPAIAIGNALGYGQSVTTGVISAVDRDLTMSDGTVAEGLIQTDAAINPGNSGGALLNAHGEVIGINSSKIGGATVDGVGFAIPISSAEPILKDIVTSSDRVKVASDKAGYLGIGGVTVTDEASEMYNIPAGVVVRQVYRGTGAEEAGIQEHDVICSVGGRDISSLEELREELEYYEAGMKVQVGYYRMSDDEYQKYETQVELIDKNTLDEMSSGR